MNWVEVRVSICHINWVDYFTVFIKLLSEKCLDDVIMAYYRYLIVFFLILSQYLLYLPYSFSELFTTLIDDLLFHEIQKNMLFLLKSQVLVLLDMLFPCLLMMWGQMLYEPQFRWIFHMTKVEFCELILLFFDVMTYITGKSKHFGQ